MARDLILGTAGHIDHGKTALVAALTGAAGDRLPEEKARGITIDLGFSHFAAGGVRFGVVDVPGHERYVRNMVAGAAGVDLALLVVSAVESVKPQTREHLDILDLLGVAGGAVALTKADLADADTIRLVELEVRDLLAGTRLAEAAIVPTSSMTGQGIAELKAVLAAAADTLPGATDDEPFRLAIDRAFVVQGHGTVVTGTVTAGAVAAGDEVDWHPGDSTVRLVRVRAVTNHGAAVGRAGKGQRAGLNLAGVPLDDVRRGQELASPGALAASKVLTVELRVPGDATRGIKHRLPVRVHLGTAEVAGTVAMLDADAVPPGGSGYAQIFLAHPAVAAWGQRFVLRDSSGESTLGGGRVLQPMADKIRRRHWDKLERVEQLGGPAPAGRLAAVAWFAGPAGFPRVTAWRDGGIPPNQVADVVAETTAARECVEVAGRLLHRDRLSEIEDAILAELAARHDQHPLMSGHDAAAVFARLAYAGDAPLLHAVAARLKAAGKVSMEGTRLARADRPPRLSAALRALKAKIVSDFREAGFVPPEPEGYAARAKGNAPHLADVFEVACADGDLVKVGPGMYLHAEAEAEMVRRVTERLRAGGATVAELRDLLGTTRKYAIPFCEHLDRTGVTRRAGDLRELPAAS